MVRIAGVNIPPKKQLWVALTYIHGIGRKTAIDICDTSGISSRKIVSDLSEDEEISLRNIIDKKYVVEKALRDVVSKSIRRLISIRCFRGLRHQNGLPVRGQRSHTNARTRKKSGKRSS